MRVVLEWIIRMIPFIAVFGAALCAYAGVGPWIIGISAVALFSTSRVEYSTLYGRAEKVSATAMINSTTLRSVTNSVVASAAAYASGVFLRLL